MTRYGGDGSVTDMLNMSYIGNVLAGVTHNGVTKLYSHDAGDRLVLMQDGRLRAEGNLWSYTVYDALGREIERTVVRPDDPSATASSIRTSIGSSQYLYPGLAGSQDGLSPVGFTLVRRLSSTRYGGQYYRRDGTSSSQELFSLPSSLAFVGETGFAESSDLSGMTSNLKVYEKVWLQGNPAAAGIAAGSAYVERSYHYDLKGRVVQVVERNAWGGIDRTSTSYDFVGNPLRTKESRMVPSGAPGTTYSVYTRTTESTFDGRGRILGSTVTVEGGGLDPTSATAEWTYDALGRTGVLRSGDGTLRELAYSIQGWQSGISARTASGADIFTQTIHYHDAPHPQYSGKVGNVTYRQGSSTARSFDVAYDSAGRLTSWKPSSGNAYSERDITYDLNGNIRRLKRYGASSAVAENLSYGYDGNLLTAVMRNGVGSMYSYDADGSMVSDGLRGISCITYGDAGMPVRIEKADGTTVDYLYLTDGTKTASVSAGRGRAYLGSMVFDVSAVGSSASFTFESADGVCGRIVELVGSTVPNYEINDYLGFVINLAF